MVREIQGWECEYCNFARARKHLVQMHERRCKHNPNRVWCWSCKFFIVGDEGWYCDVLERDIEHGEWNEMSKCELWEKKLGEK